MTSSTETVVLHGHRVAYRREGRGNGPTIVLVHGIAGTKETWDSVVPALAAANEVIALDLPGHGGSEPPLGDYSIGAYANALRDLLELLEIEAATIAGHSLGGGVAMQFSYQFPERVQRLVLVNSGGLGREVSPFVRAAALPGAELVVPLLASLPARQAGRLVGAALAAVGQPPGTDLREGARSLAALSHAPSRRAFLGTVRALMNPLGQRVAASDKLYLAEEVPTLLVWGSEDHIIPVSHGQAACRTIPGCRFEVFEGAGHFPHIDEPERFAALLTDFVATTAPADYDRERLRAALGG
ncbi:MAG TPA: alpha/beta fold hydrolase [Capillimicrobium sp.]